MICRFWSMTLNHHTVAELSKAETARGATLQAAPYWSSAASSRIATLKVGLVHDWLVSMRGGEKVLEVLCQRFPEAPIWTLVYNPEAVSSTISSHRIKSSVLQHLPFGTTQYRHYLPLFPLLAELTTVHDCDIVISSSHAVAKAMVRKDKHNRPLHICYIHTPMRYIWDRFDDYFGPQQVGHLASRFFFHPIAKALRAYDRQTIDRVDVFVANSRFVAQRVKHHYGRDAEIIAPPVDIERFGACKRSPEDWYLMVSALAPYKRVDHAIRACSRLGRELKVVGKGPEEGSLKMLAHSLGAPVEFLGFVDDSELVTYYARARALVFPGVEDFGIVPVEAIAAGCPVIALAKGGILDSMTRDTAQLYFSEEPEGLEQAMVAFESRTFVESELRARAASFAPEQFLGRFEDLLARAVSNWQGRKAV